AVLFGDQLGASDDGAGGGSGIEPGGERELVVEVEVGDVAGVEKEFAVEAGGLGDGAGGEYRGAFLPFGGWRRPVGRLRPTGPPWCPSSSLRRGEASGGIRSAKLRAGEASLLPRSLRRRWAAPQ